MPAVVPDAIYVIGRGARWNRFVTISRPCRSRNSSRRIGAEIKREFEGKRPVSCHRAEGLVLHLRRRLVRAI